MILSKLSVCLTHELSGEVLNNSFLFQLTCFIIVFLSFAKKKQKRQIELEGSEYLFSELTEYID